jgi:hypothetical protein
VQAAHALTEDESQHHDQPERLRAFALCAALSRAWQEKGRGGDSLWDVLDGDSRLADPGDLAERNRQVTAAAGGICGVTAK